MKARIEIHNGIVIWNRYFNHDKIVGAVVEGRLVLNEDFHKMLIEKKATIQVGYKYVAPKYEFRRKF